MKFLNKTIVIGLATISLSSIVVPTVSVLASDIGQDHSNTEIKMEVNNFDSAKPSELI